MAAVSLRLNDDEYKLLKTYAEANSTSVSAVIKEAIFDKIEDEVEITEEQLEALWEQEKDKPSVPIEQVWKEMGL